MKNREIAKALNTIADLLEIRGDNPFRIRAYRRAAQILEDLQRSVEEMSDQELLSLPGIGKDLLTKIRQYQREGKMEFLEQLKREVPEGLTELMAVPGLGPATARLIYEHLGIRDVDALERAAMEGVLRGVPGIREKTEKNILKGIQILKRTRVRRPIGMVMPLAEEILEALREVKGVKRCAIAGSLRRWKETIKDVDILACAEDPQRLIRAFVSLPSVERVLVSGPAKTSVILRDALQVDLRIVQEDSFGSALQYFTGSKEHNIRLRELAQRKGLKVNEYGVYRSDGTRIGGETEEGVYQALGLPFIPPELREDRGEIEAAMDGRLPELISIEDIRGDLHIHSIYSDGRNRLEELVEEAMRRGYQYIAITDHSRRLAIAGGLDEDRILEQIREIDALNKKLNGFRVFSGVEVDIMNDGRLDLPEETLSRLDFVIASIHSGLKQSSEILTMRILKAIGSSYVRMIGHPTGRLMPDRDACEVDLETVYREASRTGTALEINAFPMRLDLNDTAARRAAEHGVKLIISTDAHLKDQMGYMRYGVAVARRAWLRKEDVLNTLTLPEFQNWLRNRKAPHSLIS